MVGLVVLDLNVEYYLAAADGIDFVRRRNTTHLRLICGLASERHIHRIKKKCTTYREHLNISVFVRFHKESSAFPHPHGVVGRNLQHSR